VNLLISRHDKIGDFVLTLPTFQVAKNQIPNVKVIALVSKINYELASSMEFIDEVVVYDDNLLTLTKKIKDKNIDISISAFTDTKLAIALLLAGVKKRYAPATKIAQVFSNYRVKQRRSQVKMTECEYNLDLLKSFYPKLNTEYKKPLLEFSKSEKDDISSKFKLETKIDKEYKYIAFHPGFGGSSDGNLTLDDYIKLAKSISHKEGIKIVFTFGPDDKSSKEYIESKIDFDVILYESKLSLVDFCKLLCSFELFISTSTGPMHLAGAVNTKTLSFFGNSLFASAKRWATISQKEKQNNFSIPENYSVDLYSKVEHRLFELLKEMEK
jgi:ADP-heptose:LPS heptosyltransferase